MFKSALLLAVVATSSLSPALAIPLGMDRSGGVDGGASVVGPRRPGQVVTPSGQHADTAMGPRRPGLANSAVDPVYLADR